MSWTLCQLHSFNSTDSSLSVTNMTNSSHIIIYTYYTATQNAAKGSIDLNGPPRRSEVWYFFILQKMNDRCHWLLLIHFFHPLHIRVLFVLSRFIFLYWPMDYTWPLTGLVNRDTILWFYSLCRKNLNLPEVIFSQWCSWLFTLPHVNFSTSEWKALMHAKYIYWLPGKERRAVRDGDTAVSLMSESEFFTGFSHQLSNN